MPKFHLHILPLINTNNDYHIELDDIPYNENESYSNVRTIYFSNKYGSIRLKGFFDLSNKNILSLIIINKLYIQISKQLLNSCKYNFCKYKQEIEFNLLYNDINSIKNIEQFLINEYNCKIDYKNRKIYILLNEIKNIDIIHQIGGQIEEEDSLNYNYSNIIKNRQKIKNIDDDNFIHLKFKDIKSNFNNDENIQNENNLNEDNEEANDSLNNIEMEDVNPFNTQNSDKIEEKKVETYSDLNMGGIDFNFGKPAINYIKSKEIDNISSLLIKSDKINYLTKIINPSIKEYANKLISNGFLYMKKNKKIYILNSIDINGRYLLLNTDNNNINGKNYKFELNNISINNDISDNSDDLNEYKQVIFDNYINILDNINKTNNNNLDINDYTHIILVYINQIQNKINEIVKKDNYNNKYITKYKKICSTLKLFCILFLNCFMYKPENEYINDPNLFTNSFSDKTMSYRKRHLIEWCIDEQKTKLEQNISNLNINNIDNNISDKKASYEKLYSFGQIKKNIDNNSNDKKVSLFMRAKMSNNNEKISKDNMYYFTGFNALYGENNRQFRDMFIDKYNNDWLSFLIQSLLYIEKRDEYIIYSIELLSKNINNMNHKAKPIVNNANINNNVVYDINFILLKLYENYIKGDINEQIKYLKMMSFSSIINNNNTSDHFIQYIICSILLKIIPIIFPKDDQIHREITDKIFIKKITYNLLLKSIEELLILTNQIYEQNSILSKYGYAIKLIQLSFLNNKTKNILINNIISKTNIPPESLNSIENSNSSLLTEKQKYNLLAVNYNSLCLWKSAYNCFVSAKEFKYALDACINYAVAEMKKYEEKTDFKEIFLRLDNVRKNEPELFVDIYYSFYLFTKYMSENNKNGFGINDVIALLKEFSSKEKYFCKELIDGEIKGIIIDLLYKLLIRINKANIAIGNCELIEKKYIKLYTELYMMNNALLDNIKYRNKIFSS